jgi:hypothetical protein
MNRKLLVAYSMSSTHVQTTLDYLTALKIHLGYETYYLHVTHGAQITMDFNSLGIDIVFHNYCSRFCFDGYVSSTYRRALKAFKGLKILAVQDEYDFTNKLKDAILEHGFQIVLTCVPQDSLSYVYPGHEFPNIEFITVFTGYVPDGFAETHKTFVPLEDRPILVGYRGRDIGPRYGRLGLEKYEVGRRMKDICDTAGMANDIAMTEESRIYGTAWFDFVGQCRSMLGSESGSNVFDFDGSIRNAYDKLAASTGRVPKYEEFYPLVEARDKEISMGQISPRVFECAVMRTPMILLRGRYSDAIEPETHYIALEKDFSNADDVLRQLRDLPALSAMAERAHDHLVGSGNFGYKALLEKLKQRIERYLSQTTETVMVQTEMTFPETDPRLKILTEHLSPYPRGQEEFNTLQRRLTGLVYAAEVARIDTFYSDAIRGCVGKVVEISRLMRHSANRRDPAQATGFSQAHLEAMRQFSARYAATKNLKSKYQIARAGLKALEHAANNWQEHGSIAILQEQISALDQEWIGTYSCAYNDFHESYLKCLAAMNAQNPASFARNLAERPIDFILQQAIFIRRTSKLELAKYAIKRVPGARRALLLALRYLPSWR